ncbi:RecF/RecN/SMC [Cynara cardunculus var. scolymus]|uniref:Structural maintenance of chromosomes protein n=1 Tax=Cynara cardunculus var. scolymus TaxID=59895 RepID=A0A103Y4X0_CYNCS|nr:RecF/RecN/SMC [Cynara cardunculus var. scolymus]
MEEVMDTAGEFISTDPTSTPGKKSASPPRLFIKEMVMKNFKSYAGEQRVGPFHKVRFFLLKAFYFGPNGSGKSNVIDAMLFVFGKRAKQMRLNKVSELIHNSTNHQNLNSARVSVHFQEIIDLDDGTYEVVPGSDFIIAREAFRDNSSKYYINGRDSKFTEVTKKLKGKGVDLDNNRFLILQVWEFMQDKLESLNEKRSGVVQMVKLADKERESLESVKNEAEDYMLKELSLLKWQEKAVKFASEENDTKMEEIQKTRSSLQENLTAEREKIQESKKALKELETLHNKYMKRQEFSYKLGVYVLLNFCLHCLKELDTGLKRCKDEFKEFERQDVKHREDLKHVKQKIKKMDEKVEKDSTKITDITRQSEESANLIPKLEEEIPKLQKKLLDEDKILEEITESSKVETEAFRTEVAKVRTELKPWEKELIEHHGKLEVASTEKKLLTEKHEAGCAAYVDAQEQLNDLQKRIETKTSSIKDMQSKLEKNKLELSKARKVEQECLKEQETLMPLEQAARQKVTELKSVMETERNHGSVLRAILQAKASNAIEGIYGRMGDLGAIDGKYDVAISTACPGLDYIVVETTAAAQACVDMLRKNSLGVATFMILEKQADHMSRMKEKVSTPEGVPRLFDLIKVQDERMKLAFFAAMGNTVVAKDIDQATRIAYGVNKEFRRVVTLDGALFEKSGTMSGGGNKPRGGKMGTSIRATSVSGEAVAEAENELAQIADRLSNLRQQISEVVRHYKDLEKTATHIEMELAKSQKEVKIESLNSQHEYLGKQLDSLKAAAKPSKAEVSRLKELAKVISEEENEIKRLTLGSKQLKEKVLELQSKIENAGGERLKSQKAKVNKIQNDIDKNSTEMNRHKVQIETGKKLLKKLTDGIDESKNEKERLVAQKEKLLNTFKEIEQKAFKVQDDYKKTEELINQHKDVLGKAKSDYEKLKKSVDELRASEVDADYKLQDMMKMFKELEMKAKGYRKKLEDLNNALSKHMEQIKKDLVDPEKLQATLGDESFSKGCDLKRALETVALLEAQMKEMNPNLDSISDYRKKVSVYNERVEELNLVTNERDETKRQYDEWRKKRQVYLFPLDEFMAGFNTISMKLKEMYQMITLGGDAELELVDSLDPFSEGVVFSVRPPKKSWKNIANLSGGEKVSPQQCYLLPFFTLSSLALVFALHHYKPTPLYVMDEIDAALDFKNVSIVGHYVKDRTKDAQFIIISLRNNMFELADRLVGIYKTDNCTKSITINPGSFVVREKVA